MKTDFQKIKKMNLVEGLLTIIVLGLVIVMMAAGAHLTGLINLPARVLPYIGGALLSFVLLGGFIITYNSVKFMLDKEK